MNKLSINDQFLDGVSLVAQTFSTNEFGDITTRQGSSSNDFSFPLNDRNKELLGFPEDLNNAERNQYTRIASSLFDDNVFIAKGYLKIVRVDVSNKQAVCEFFTSNSEWFSLIKNKTLKDLDLSVLNHDYTIASVVNSFDNETGFIYPIIDYGEFLTNSDVDLEVFVEQMFPAVYYPTLVEQLFFDIGYTVEGELLDLPTFKNMTLAFSDKEFSPSQQFITDNTVSYGSSDQTVNPNNSIIWDQTIPDDEITLAYRSFYTVKVNLDITLFTDNEAYTLFLRNGATEVGRLLRNQFTAGFYQFTFEDIEINVGDIITVFLDDGGVGGTTAIELEGNNTTIELIPASKIYEGNGVEVANILPDIKQSDFLKYLFNLFGVLVQVDVLSKRVSLDLFRNVALKKNQALDWSSKIDVSSIKDIDFTELVGSYAQLSEYNYLENDDDDLLDTYSAQNNIRFGSGLLTIDNDHIENRKEIYEAPFAPCINRMSFNNRLYIPQIKWLNDDGTKDVTPKPVTCLTLTGFDIVTLSGDGTEDGFFTIKSYDSLSDFEVTEIPFSWFAKAPYVAEIDAIEDSLSFGNITFTSETEGKLQEYSADQQIILSNIKYVIANFLLNAVDINNLNFSIPIYIDYFKSYFYINIVNEYTGSQDVTEVELIKI